MYSHLVHLNLESGVKTYFRLSADSNRFYPKKAEMLHIIINIILRLAPVQSLKSFVSKRSSHILFPSNYK
ncbi:MAG: hypothetical protein A2Z86_07425 [Candidatus Glassbacteria bacterium GWA2_58_10]|uniref:Uncharacterized protein n=1 Tax=Candidatus Glassbacteria bacterium GWA2_58_10 TaxID=1817865 RepID=A0A1F5YGV0_9BACT|nr:MAG: hypothetical protein A2Z86_07425 [Candidatus Glassbacteria bacterium GWA2_58_10]